MSEKVKEFVEIPQQFLRDGNQVSFFAALESLLFIGIQFITRCTKPSQKGDLFRGPDETDNSPASQSMYRSVKQLLSVSL